MVERELIWLVKPNILTPYRKTLPTNVLGEFFSTLKVDNDQYVSKGEKGILYLNSVSHLIGRISLCHILQQDSGPSHFANLKIIDIF